MHGYPRRVKSPNEMGDKFFLSKLQNSTSESVHIRPMSFAILVILPFLFQFQQIFATVYSNLQADQFQGDFINVIYRNNSVDSDLASSFDSSWLHSGHSEFEIENMGLPIQNASVMQQNPVFRNFLRSDHTSFWLRDLPAIFLTDSGKQFSTQNAELNDLTKKKWFEKYLSFC